MFDYEFLCILIYFHLQTPKRRKYDHSKEETQETEQTEICSRPEARSSETDRAMASGSTEVFRQEETAGRLVEVKRQRRAKA